MRVPVALSVLVPVSVLVSVPMAVVVLEQGVGVLRCEGSHTHGWIGRRAVGARYGAWLDMRVFVACRSAPEGVGFRRHAV